VNNAGGGCVLWDIVPASRGDGRIDELVLAARQALDSGDYLAVLEACERAVRLDPRASDARALAHRARTTLDEEQIARKLAEAVEILNREDWSEGDLAAAATYIDRALTVNPVDPAALAARRRLLDILDRRRPQPVSARPAPRRT
jgi:tetratricopeptide (TPR) repeat protein